MDRIANRIARAFVGLLVFSPALALAQSAFVGTWKADLHDNIQLPSKPYSFLLSGGSFTCKLCAPAYTVAADGQDHAVAGHPYFDSAAVKVIDDRTVEETDKKGGKVVITVGYKVSDDGNTIVWDIVDGSASSAEPIKFKAEGKRLTPAAAGANQISGNWKAVKYLSFSDNGTLTTWSLSGDTLNMSTPTGQSYTATLDGADVPFHGDPGQTAVSIKKVDDHTLQETDKRDGKVIGSATLTVLPDGKRMRVAWKDDLRHASGSFFNVKQ